MTRRVLITGANKGIGRAIVAAVLDAADDTAVLLGARDPGRGESARAAILEAHPGWADRLEVVTIDVADDASVTAAAKRVGGPLYGIVNNAGVGRGAGSTRQVLDVNTHGPRRVCAAFLPLLAEGGRVVNVASASGPNFVADCAKERQRTLTDPEVAWADVQALIDDYLAIEAAGGDLEEAGLKDDVYGLSKACLNAYTIELARTHPALTINACTPGFIETDMTRPYAEARGASPEDMGMKSPSAGARAPVFLLLGDVGGSGWYFGSDAERSPLDRYRSPGDPPYSGE